MLHEFYCCEMYLWTEHYAETALTFLLGSVVLWSFRMYLLTYYIYMIFTAILCKMYQWLRVNLNQRTELSIFENII